MKSVIMINKLGVRGLLCRVKLDTGSYNLQIKNLLKHVYTTTGNAHYEEAVKTLNSLQTNASTIEKIKKHNTDHIFEVKKLEDTIKYLTRTGVTLEKIDDLPLIHVSGTKGKGSTCAFCESILRHHGYKTGFYSSPHLVAVRERIRLNGEPLSQQDFTRHFWKVYNKLDNFKDNEHDMPPYFKFLTVMAFNVFLAEKVDVAIIEVGIGGEYDCTNVIRHVSTVGITSLALDHTDILGNTIEEIAWQKAGIMKPGSIAITSTLLIAPAFEKYDWKCFIPQLDFLPDVQLLNASFILVDYSIYLFIFFCINIIFIVLSSFVFLIFKYIDNKAMEKKEDVFLKKTTNFMEIPIAPSFAITQNMANGLKYCKWPGRNQIITDGRIHYFLDGAHTKESLEHGADCDNPLRVLVFNCTGNRNSKSLLSPLLSCGFHLVIFCPNITTTTTDPTSVYGIP
ncbi:Folylpolyglutamate synthase [Blattella germanica]|nr:Folylpolyglutamate synthase [Blattella germanica]